jgi:hypothetical protein
MAPGRIVYGQVMLRQRTNSLRFKTESCKLREKTLTEYQSFRVDGGWRRVDNPTKKNYLSQNLKKAILRGGGAHGAVELIMMMIKRLVWLKRYATLERLGIWKTPSIKTYPKQAVSSGKTSAFHFGGHGMECRLSD